MAKAAASASKKGGGDGGGRVGGAAAAASRGGVTGYRDKSKPGQVRDSNITAAKAIADAVRTSLGPRGMDKMIQSGSGDVTITNDGATILKQMKVIHPAATMLVELSKAQDVEAGDGTTSVVVIAGALLDAAQNLLEKGIHPTTISDSFQAASAKSMELLSACGMPVNLDDTKALVHCATTSLNSKVVSQYSSLLAPLAVDAIMKVADIPGKNVDLRDIRIVKKVGGTVEDTEMINGMVFTERTSGAPGAPSKVDNAKIGLIQFCLSPPKTNMENKVYVSDYTQMDRALREERQYILSMVKQIHKAGCNVLLIQKSILRDATNDLALHFLAKMKIMVVRDVEREDIDFICKTLGCRPVASIDHFLPDALAHADRVQEVAAGGTGKVVKVTGIANAGRTVSILIRGVNQLVVDEVERSLHDALCVLRCLVKNNAIVPGGGAPEIEIALRLYEYSQKLTGMEAYCFRAFAEALEVIPYTLAENAGLNPIGTVTDLRNKHAADGTVTSGINVRKGMVGNILEEDVVQPLLVTASAISLATETVRSILKIDDIVATVR